MTEPYTAVQCAEWAESGDRMSEPISASWSADAAYFCSGEEEFMPF